MGLKIIGTGSKLPKRRVANDELAQFLDTNNEWIASKTGIKTRAVCTDESLTDLATEATIRALESARLDISDIDMIICSTVSADFITPSLACCVLQRLGAECPAFDVSAACTGFIYALDLAEAYINSGKANNILIISAEMMSRIVDWNDRNTCILFGDGAGACVVSRGDAIRYIKLHANGDLAPLYARVGTGNSPFALESESRGFLCMRGRRVFKFASKTVEAEINKAMERLEMNAEDVDHFILHQANKLIIDSARTRLGLPDSKFPINIDQHGNMSAASIPVLLDEMVKDSRIKTGDTLVFVGFGAGMTYGICVMVW